MLIVTAYLMSQKPADLSARPPAAGRNSSLFDSGDDSFSFASMGDSQAEAANFATTVNKVATLNPDLVNL